MQDTPHYIDAPNILKLRAQQKTGRILWIVAAIIFFAYLCLLLFIVQSDLGLGGLMLFFFTMPVPFVAGTMFVIGVITSLSASKKLAETK